MLIVPNLPDFDPATEMPMREAAKLLPNRPDWRQVRRWGTEGVRVVSDRDVYLFPSEKFNKVRVTCRPWVDAWLDFIARLRIDYARRRQEQVERCRAAAKG